MPIKLTDGIVTTIILAALSGIAALLGSILVSQGAQTQALNSILSRLNHFDERVERLQAAHLLYEVRSGQVERNTDAIEELRKHVH